MGKRLIQADQEVVLELPYSEVCMHLRVAGTRMRARLLATGMVQLLDPDGREFSFPIIAAEAGLDHDHSGWFSVAGDPPAPLADQPPLDATATGDDHRPVLQAASAPLTIEEQHSRFGEVIHSPDGPLSWHPEFGDLPVSDPEPDESP